MSRILLDTSAYSAFMRGDDFVVTALQRAEQIYLNPIVLGEMRAGFRKGSKRRQNEEELRRFLDSPRVELLDIDDETAERYALIVDTLRRAGTPVASHDLWIAATAMQYGLRLLTLDTDFLKIPQIVVDLKSAVR
jgi:tRNA(fMet)-specific endonuclease VapC